jgi:hypothetical protein
MTDAVISWNTTKTADGFQYRVYSVTHGEPTKTLQVGTTSSRAKAKLMAQKWTRYLKTR